MILVLVFALVAPFQLLHAHDITGKNKQVIDIRTHDPNNPLLLFLSGGPGSSMLKNSESFTAMFGILDAGSTAN